MHRSSSFQGCQPGLLRPQDARMLSRWLKIAPHRSGGHERGNHPRPRIEWLTRGMGLGNGTLAVPGDRCRSTRGRLEDAFDLDSRMETGQHLSLARDLHRRCTAPAANRQ